MKNRNNGKVINGNTVEMNLNTLHMIFMDNAITSWSIIEFNTCNLFWSSAASDSGKSKKHQEVNHINWLFYRK